MPMIKKSKNPKRKFNSTITLLWLAVAALLIIQVVTLSQLHSLKVGQSETDKRLISDLINKSEQRRYKLPIIDITEGRVYIPEVNGFIPLTDTSRGIRYDYFDVKDNEILYLSRDGIIGNQTTEQTDPSCDKIIAITRNSNAMSNFTYVGSIPEIGNELKHVFKHYPCNSYTEELATNLAATALSIRAY